MADPTIIDAGTRIDGRISGDADVTVQGRVDGEIALTQTLTVADGGFVTGTINVREAVVEGAVDGDIVADERIFLTATARVVGTLTAPAIQMDDGAQFAGEVAMDLDAEVTPRAETRERNERPAAKTTAAATPARTPATTGRAAPERTPARAPAATAAATAPAARTTTTTTTVEEPSEAEEAAAEPDDAGEADLTGLSANQLQDLTVKELREELRERDMQVSGTKDELIERLQNAGD